MGPSQQHGVTTPVIALCARFYFFLPMSKLKSTSEMAFLLEQIPHNRSKESLFLNGESISREGIMVNGNGFYICWPCHTGLIANGMRHRESISSSRREVGRLDSQGSRRLLSTLPKSFFLLVPWASRRAGFCEWFYWQLEAMET